MAPTQAALQPAPPRADTTAATSGQPVGPGTFATNQTAANQVDADEENARRKERYLTAYANWVANMESGQTMTPEARVPPAVPTMQALGDPDQYGVRYFIETSTPVTEALPNVFYHGITEAQFQAGLQPGVTDIGDMISPGWFKVGRTDTRPVGFKATLPGPDDKLITLQKWGSPWGSKYEVVG